MLDANCTCHVGEFKAFSLFPVIKSFRYSAIPLFRIHSVPLLKQPVQSVKLIFFYYLSRSAAIESCKSMQIRTDCKIWPSMLKTNNIVITWLSHHALISLTRTQCSLRLIQTDLVEKWLHTTQQHWVLACKHHTYSSSIAGSVSQILLLPAKNAACPMLDLWD